jgi:hypothetical protein
MLRRVGAAVLMALVAQAPAMAQTPAAPQRAEACLRANAGRVAAMDHSLESAAGFLVNYVCAEEVEAASRFQRNSDLVAILEKGAPGASAKITVDPESGRLRVPVEPGKSPTDGLGAINLLQSVLASSPSPSLRALAGQLILQARLAGGKPH